ncbi:MAG: sulfatase [Candidatus Hydrogenedentota bacterium]
MSRTSRRSFLQAMFQATALSFGTLGAQGTSGANKTPNLLLIMCDDLGFGDTGFNGNSEIRTPNLDRLCAEGARFTRFYSGSPVCSPTRATCLTGRHHARLGVMHANEGCLPRQEITIAEICRYAGYRTGHFGKWHLGTMSTTEKDGNRGGPDHPEFYSPPWDHGYDTCFCTEALVPTWNPGLTPAEGNNLWGTPGTRWRSAYWNEQGKRVTENLDGDDARVIIDRVEPFFRTTLSQGVPFMATIWFHTPHAPVVAGPDYRAMYADHPEGAQHYFGSITAMDEQVGRINKLLTELGVDQNTFVLFASDNGPEGSGDDDPVSRFHGSTAHLRGRKRSLYSGGITVPAFAKWPGRIEAGSTVATPCSTLDYLPTLCDLLGYVMPDVRPIDGISLMPALSGKVVERDKIIPLFFLDSERGMAGSPTLGTIGDRYKFLTNLSNSGTEDQLYDVLEDEQEANNLAASKPDYVSEQREYLRQFLASCRHSHQGGDYSEPYKAVTEFPLLTGGWKG